MAKKVGSAAHPPAKAGSSQDWNVFVYLAGDNNLSEEMVWSLLGMQAIAADPGFATKVNVTAVYDPAGEAPLQYRFKTSNRRRFGLSQFGGDSPLAGLPAQGALDQLKYFIERQISDQRLYPRGRSMPNTMVVLSGHGDGLGGLLNEDSPLRALSIRDLGSALQYATDLGHKLWKTPKTPKIKILGMESCAMSVLEVCYQVRDTVDYVLATESFVQNNGWPYARMLRPLVQSPGAVVAAKRMANIYGQYYAEYDVAGLSTDIAVIDAASLRDGKSGLVEALNLLATQLSALLYQAKNEVEGAVPGTTDGDALRDALTTARWNAQSYNQDDYVDVGDFCSQLERALALRPTVARFQEIVATCKKVRKALWKVVKVSLYQGPLYQHSNGLAIYFPSARSHYASQYEELGFAARTRWPEFLKLYLEKSQRCQRQDNSRARTFAFSTNRGLADVALVPGANGEGGAVRNPAKGSDRSVRMIDGYAKNSPFTWQRDSRVTPPDENKM